MWPWGHLAVAYLVYVALTRLHPAIGETPATIAALLVGSQGPDVVDKPLAWTFDLLPSGRSLGHSLLFAIPLVVAVGLLARRWGRGRAAAAFGVGYLTHSVSDLPPRVWLAGDLQWATYLAWPLLPSPPYELDQSFVAHVAAVSPTPFTLFQVALVVLAGVVWWRRGRTGATAVRTRLGG